MMRVHPGFAGIMSKVLATVSIRKLKQIARQVGEQIWTIRDIAFYQQCHPFPVHYE